LEAMAAAVPVVATRVGGVPELVEDGVTGRLVPPADAAALSAAIEPLLTDPPLPRQFGRAGRVLAERRFSMEGMADATHQLYVNLLATGRRRRRLVSARAVN